MGGVGGCVESLQPNRYYESDSYFKHFLGESSFDIINKSHHMDNDENLKTKPGTRRKQVINKTNLKD